MTSQTVLRTLLKRPCNIKTKSQAKQLHAQVLKLKPFSPDHLSKLISIYSNLKLLHHSLLLFNSLLLLHSSPPPTLAFKSIIRCYAANGLFHEALASFVRMKASGKNPDHNVLPSVLQSCTLLLEVKFGESVHGCIVRSGWDFDLSTCNALMDMYAKFPALDENGLPKIGPRKVFEEMPERMFDSQFRSEFVHDYETGKVGVDQNVSLIQDRSVLPQEVNDSNVRELGKRGSRLDSVRKVFEMMPKRDIISWNTVIAGNAQNGMYEEALLMVRDMGNEKLKPDSFTLSTVLPIFTEYVDVKKGKEIHGYAIRHEFDRDVFMGSGLIDMYAKCTRVEDSLRVFSLLPQRDNILWSSIIAGCVQNGLFDEGLRFFRQMLRAKVKPNSVSFSSIMPACSHLTTLCLGKQLHGYIIRGGFDNNMFIASSLVDMYAKCGNIKVARLVFEKMELRDAVPWTAIIMGCALHGHACDAISLFEQMEMQGVRPNSVSFVAVLTACSHTGFVDEAWRYFNSMSGKYGIAPGLEHYVAMADLLGRAGKLNEAYELISSMHKPSLAVWSTILFACRVHKNVDLAEKVAEKIFEVDPENIEAYILMSNIYAAAQKWKDAAKLRVSIREKGLKKQPACSWIEVRNKRHAFIAGDRSHPDYDKISEALNVLLEKMEQEGYVPDTNAVFHDMKEEKKELLFNCSE